jgi:hypothetical protein
LAVSASESVKVGAKAEKCARFVSKLACELLIKHQLFFSSTTNKQQHRKWV